MVPWSSALGTARDIRYDVMGRWMVEHGWW